MDNSKEIVTIPQVWYVNRSSPVPLYKQLSDNIKWSIYLGNIGNGWKLPTVRLLAKELDISIDTVRAAYKILEESGLITARPHHGTVVAIPDDRQSIVSDIMASEEANLSSIISQCLSKGMNEQQIRSLFAKVLEREIQGQSKPRLLLIECNEEDGARFQQQLSSLLDIRVDVIMVDKLNELLSDTKAASEKYVAVITTYFHFAVVMQQVAPLRIPVYAVVTEMGRSTQQKLRDLASGTKIGVILKPGHSMDYLLGMITAVRNDLTIKKAILGQKKEIDELVKWADIFFSTHPCESEIYKRTPEATVLFFCDSINAQSIGILRENLNSLV